jgi:hypothetical protein
VLRRTEFDGLYDVFEGAWKRIVNAITIAHRFGLGVLLGAYILSTGFPRMLCISVSAQIIVGTLFGSRIDGPDLWPYSNVGPIYGAV